MSKQKGTRKTKLMARLPSILISRVGITQKPFTALAVLLVVTVTGVLVYRATHAATAPMGISADQRTFADPGAITALRDQELALNEPQPANSCQVFPNTQLCNVTSSAPATATGTTASDKLVYHGGPVQHSPVLLFVEWGPKWSTDTSIDPEVGSLMGGLGVESAPAPDFWSTTTAQYQDSTGAPSFRRGGGRVIVDTSTPPFGATQAQLAAEAKAIAKQYVTPGNFLSTSIVVATQSGTCPAGFAANPPCPSGGYYCGWHNHTTISLNATSYNVPYINLPWMGDTTGCHFSSTAAGDYSVVLGHEYAEAITDPLLNGWTGGNGEIADECVGPGQPVNFATGSFLEQPLYSNAAQACVMTSGVQGGVVSLNGACVDDNNSVLAAGNKIDIWTCNHTSAQRVTYYGPQTYGNTTFGGDGTLRVLGRCLSDKSNGGAGSAVVLNSCAGAPPNESWDYNSATGAYKLRLNGLCLRDPGNSTTNGTQLDIYTCTGSANEHWSSPQG